MNSISYLDAAADFYRAAAREPQEQLCCTATPVWKLPDLVVPDAMIAMNYGCGSTVHLQDLDAGMTVLYVGVGAGLEALQFAYFTRAERSVIAVDRVPEMLAAAERNLAEAAQLNPWFDPSFIDLRLGDALALPVGDDSIDVTAENCLFNIFVEEDLMVALRETRRVLKPHGKLVLSDPVSPEVLPQRLRADDRLRAMCLSGAQTYERYLELLVEAGFGTIEVRSRQPYRVLDRRRYGLDRDIVLESIEVAAIADPIPGDGACIFTGRTAIYVGEQAALDDGAGHVLPRDMPMPVCDKTAAKLSALDREDIIVTGATYHYRGGGCC
jgi:ubiquinone/menaquinone biosynthesis C-methylase UbiE